MTLLGVLAIAAGAGYVHAASAKSDFSVTVTPATQTVSQGHTATFTASLTKGNGFADPVALSVQGLPAGARASFSPNPVVVGRSPGDKGTLTVQTNVGVPTPAGTYTLTVTGTSGSLSRSATARLVVQAAATPSFSVTATPATQTVAQADDTNYAVTISRSGGFSGAVALTASGLPGGASASFTPATVPSSADSGSSTLVITTSGSTPPGNHTITLSGAGAPGTRTTTVTLVVQKTSEFAITGNPPARIGPGLTRSLDLTLSNENNFDLKVSGIAVTVQNATSKPGCDGTENFRVQQIPPGRYPITIGADQARTLSQLGVAVADRPQLTMLNLDEPQNACLDATFRLSYAGTATK